MSVCPECTGEMKYIAPDKVCTVCGLSLSRSEYEQMHRQKKEEKFDAELSITEDPRNKKHREYLEWFEGKRD